MRRIVAATAAVLLALGPLGSPAAMAGVFDEFQVYDGRISELGFDVNQYLVFGRRGRAGDGAPRNGLLATTEIGYSMVRWHEVSVFLPAAREFSGDLYWGGFKLRNTFVVPGASDRPFAYGVDIELRHQPDRFSSTDWAVTLRPILDFRTGSWQLILNPNVEVPIGRGSTVFAPAVRGVLQVAERAWLGLEHYMELGRLDRLETHRRQAHQLFLTTDFKLSENSAIHFGVGHGLTRSSDRWAGKVILSLEF